MAASKSIRLPARLAANGICGVKDAEVLKLLELGRRRFRSADDYRLMQSYIAEATIGELKARGIDLTALNVLELGAGRGGYSLVLCRRAKSFIASDLYKDPLFDEVGITFEKVDVSRPFAFEADTFDLIYCSSLIEHISQPIKMLGESWRVLKPGGILFLSFPPFYSLAMVGGHHFKPFHFLGERQALWIVNHLRGSNIQSYSSCFGTYGLYPLTIDQVRQLIAVSGFAILDVYTRMSVVNTARLPGILKDLMTWHVCYIARKPLAKTRTSIQ